ncbi:hypothetical protein ACJMK2_041073 [Sinanodonta woodiana]|uniref:Uncharacterized protein n=1 Tax=Sinanodonta woodiana TaxID=1069815 RepID=A0ABD3W2X5_SINWO
MIIAIMCTNGMAMNITFILFCFVFFLANEGHGATWSDVSDEVVKINNIYQDKTSVIPLQDLSQTLNVSLGLQLLALNNYDDVAGIMDISTYLSMEWTEEIYFTAHGAAAPDTSVTISAASIWKPSLILVNSAGASTEIVQEQSKLRMYLKSGKCEWTENLDLQGSCRPNVYFYPFDVHDCSFKFTSRAYNSTELTLLASSFKKDYFEENVAWSVEKMSTTTLIQDSKSHVKFQIRISRRSLNFVLNYILPILILSVLNIFVFMLPRHSGERAGYSITCFLAFVVFLNTIVTSLPKSSAPVSCLVYYLTVMMVVSAIITVLVLFTLMIEKRVEKEDEVKDKRTEIQRETKGTTQKMTKDGKQKGNGNTSSSQSRCCLCFIQNRVKVIPTHTQLFPVPPRCLQKFAWICRGIVCRNDPDMLYKDAKKLRWVDVANALDVFFFVFFLVGEFIFTIGYLSPVSVQYSDISSKN